MKVNRRDFVRSAAGFSAAALLSSREALAALPAPNQSGIEHVVVVMMENRSFDHFLGWLPNAVGRQAGLSYTDCLGNTHSTYPLAPDYTGCPQPLPHADPDHSYSGARVEYNGGKMDGFLRAGLNDVYSVGYYVESDLPFYSQLARNYTTLDHYFCSILGPTFPNRIFQHAAQTDRLDNSENPSTLPTIWDRLQSAGVSGTYYYSNVPFLALWGPKYLSISKLYPQFLNDAAQGTLPAVSFLDPRYTTSDAGDGNDDHPHADIRSGDAFLAQAFHAVATGPKWKNTVFIVNFDEWGGFFEHVAPPRAIAPNAVDPDLVNGKALLGMRVPTVVASPFTRGNPRSPKVNHLVYDHTSVLKLIEWRWNLPPLTARDASQDVQNLALALNFNSPQATLPNLPQPAAPPPTPCSNSNVPMSNGCASGIVSTEEFALLGNSAILNGWIVVP